MVHEQAEPGAYTMDNMPVKFSGPVVGPELSFDDFQVVADVNTAFFSLAPYAQKGLLNHMNNRQRELLFTMISVRPGELPVSDDLPSFA